MHARYLAEDAVTMDALPAAQVEALNYDMVDDMIGMMAAVDRAIYLEDLHNESVCAGLTLAH